MYSKQRSRYIHKTRDWLLPLGLATIPFVHQREPSPSLLLATYCRSFSSPWLSFLLLEPSPTIESFLRFPWPSSPSSIFGFLLSLPSAVSPCSLSFQPLYPSKPRFSCARLACEVDKLPFFVWWESELSSYSTLATSAV